MFTNIYNSVYDDIIYFKSLYPDSIADVYRQISDAADRLEYNNSIMYDEFPDKERIRQIALLIYKNYSEEHSLALIEVLLLNEFIHRRVRRHAFE